MEKNQENSAKEQNICEFFKTETQHQLNNFNICEIKHLANTIHETIIRHNNVFISGIGKSGYIAEYICGILQSINIPIHNLNLLNSTHGDIGICRKGDIILFLSKSGNTTEIIDKIIHFKQKSVRTIGICCSTDSLFAKKCDHCIVLPLGTEYQGTINSIPTSSIISQTFFGCILCDELMKCTNIRLDEYKLNHPSGNISVNNRSIQDVMLIKGSFPIICVNDESPIYLNSITSEMLNHSMGICVITDMNYHVIGIITDGDIRRKFLNNTVILQSELNSSFYYESDLNKLLINVQNIQYIPIIIDSYIIGMIKRI